MGNNFSIKVDCNICGYDIHIGPSPTVVKPNEVKSPVPALRATVTSEIVSPVAALRLFKALVLHGHELIPRLAPKTVQDFQIIAGDGGTGTVKHVHFPQGSGLESAVHKVDVVDTENLTYAYTVVDGDVLMDKYDKIVYQMKLEPMPHGGTVVRHVGTYHTKPCVGVTDEEIKAGEEKAGVVFKAVEDYLLAYPQEFA